MDVKCPVVWEAREIKCHRMKFRILASGGEKKRVVEQILSFKHIQCPCYERFVCLQSVQLYASPRESAIVLTASFQILLKAKSERLLAFSCLVPATP